LFFNGGVDWATFFCFEVIQLAFLLLIHWVALKVELCFWAFSFFERGLFIMHTHAVIKTGGKQYKVAVGEKVKVEKLSVEVDQIILLDNVLSVGSGESLVVGLPLVKGAYVKAIVVSQGKHPKERIFKMRRRKHYQKRMGHRQMFTEIQIDEVGFSS
jgi:large subunit ribosomal protein L21